MTSSVPPPQVATATSNKLMSTLKKKPSYGAASASASAASRPSYKAAVVAVTSSSSARGFTSYVPASSTTAPSAPATKITATHTNTIAPPTSTPKLAYQQPTSSSMVKKSASSTFPLKNNKNNNNNYNNNNNKNNSHQKTPVAVVSSSSGQQAKPGVTSQQKVAAAPGSVKRITTMSQKIPAKMTTATAAAAATGRHTLGAPATLSGSRSTSDATKRDTFHPKETLSPSTKAPGQPTTATTLQQQQLHQQQASSSAPDTLAAVPSQTSPNANNTALYKAERSRFYQDLHHFMNSIGSPIQRLPTLGFKELDLWILYTQVIQRNGIDQVIAKKQWKDIADALDLPASCTDSGFRLRLHYMKYLEPYERAHFKSKGPLDDRKVRSSPSPNSDTKKTKADGSSDLSNITNEDSPTINSNSSLQKNTTSQWSKPLSAKQSLTHTDDKKKKRPITSITDENPKDTKVQRVDSQPEPYKTAIDFHKLNVSALRRYNSHYRLTDVSKNATKEELVSSVSKHFSQNTQPILNEQQTLLNFMNALRKSKTLAIQN